MKKLIVLLIALALLAVSVGTALAAPWNNPNGYWIEDVACEDGTYDVFVPNDNTEASFTGRGGVGVMKALYIDFGEGYVLVWSVRGNGVFKNTTWCEWVMQYPGEPPLPMAGKVLIP
jgi:hypothetical protein